jgi:hypothetical protein
MAKFEWAVARADTAEYGYHLWMSVYRGKALSRLGPWIARALRVCQTNAWASVAWPYPHFGVGVGTVPSFQHD